MQTNASIRLTKTFTFEMAHALEGYDGDCKNLHGHSFRLEVTLRGKPRNQRGHPKDGMLLDFRDLKQVVRNHVLDVFDHALALNDIASAEAVQVLERHYDKIVRLPFQPTCENLTLYIVEKIQAQLPPQTELYRIKLFETATGNAEWCADDQYVDER